MSMTMKSLISKSRLFLYSGHHRLFCSLPPQNQIPPSSQDLVNEISRILSDHRNPRHDLDTSLASFSSKLNTDLVEQVL
ncbi:hypothetical protein Tsubulata_049359, partial [Turnera subulata]